MHGWINVSIGGQHERYYLRLILVTFWKQRPDRPIDHSAVQDFAFGRLAFALEKPSGNLTGCVKILTVIDRKREEIQTFPRLRCARSDQHYGISVAHQCGAISLFCQLSDFDRKVSISDHRADSVNVHVFNSSL